MTKISAFLIVLFSLTSCQVSEKIVFKNDNSGKIIIEELRDENFFSKYEAMNSIEVSEKEEFVNTNELFADIILKNAENYNKFLKKDQDLLQEYKNVILSVKKDSYRKEYRSSCELSFNKIDEVPNLYNIIKYKNDLIENFAIQNSQYFFNVKYFFDGAIFKRTVTITDKEKLKERNEYLEIQKSIISKFNAINIYTLNYSFDAKIKSISNLNAMISEDRKSFNLEFKLSNCLENPEITNLEIVFED